MFRSILLLMLAFWGTTALANARDDATLFMSHFIDQKEWNKAHRAFAQNRDRLYRDTLLLQGIDIMDMEHFRDMIPKSAADEAVQQLKHHVADVIIQSYGTETLSQIADFFRTPTGEIMLATARTNKLFKQLHRQSPRGGPVEQMSAYLPIGELARYRVFTSTPAGKVFVQQTWAIRRALYYEIHEISHWPKLPLNRPYIVEIIKTDGILKFPNRVARQSLVRELSVTSP